MRRPRPVLLLCLLTLGLCMSLAACGGNQRQKTLKGTLVGLNAARDGFTSWDLLHQKSIVEKATTREEAEAKLATYRADRSTLVDALEAAYRLLAAAATQEDDPSLKAALAAAADAVNAIKKLTGGT
jgi:hypothetical protein